MQAKLSLKSKTKFNPSHCYNKVVTKPFDDPFLILKRVEENSRYIKIPTNHLVVKMYWSVERFCCTYL